ncbi:hypothetical protein Poli38472_013176 [Pythium oligandrum]|uniref:Uncharacterized protein n=1 Tax=Pythium oligandrum TaxID=41045 RepID=A0A8K1C2K2_PYTOL|nr:hypothetical protein Poli38472_013176 [Pythium oligandrum]|eukprot:TMW55285.1 hypothetical protein Poli38472_013176 [Pythium oligandrum]
MSDRTTGSSSGVHQSAKMMEAQAYFQQVVKQELQVLLTSGLDRDVAVKMLLHRIVESTDAPEESDVKRVMKQFQMNYDDAVRALIVKQEIGRLKRQGLDAFAAIEELTRKMQRISVPSSSEDEHSDKDEMSDQASVDGSVEGEEDKRQGSSEQAEDSVETSASVVEDSSSSSRVEVQPLSLCQRIDQVSISSVPPAPPSSPTASTPASHRNTAFTLFSAHSRKRRVNNGGVDSTPSSPHRSVFNTTHRPVVDRPLSPTFRFPKSKKQKIWTDEHDPLFNVTTHKTVLPASASPTAISASAEAEPLETPSRFIGKRQRKGPSSPLFDAIDVDDALVHVAKRHRKHHSPE